MKSSFAVLGENIMTRKFGGTTVGVATPYVTGTFFVWFDYLPDKITNYTSAMPSGISSIDEIQKVLAASCTGVTIPGGTLNKVEYTGLGGVKWAVPGGIDYGNTVSLKFIEFSKTPILDIMHSWVKMIRDYRLGVSDVLQDDDQGDGMLKKNYAGVLYYWTTAADAETIEYFACYDGVFPSKDPQDLYGSDIETIGRLDVEIEFNVDYPWREPWVKDKCQQFLDSFRSAKSTVKDYKPGQ